MKNYRVYVNTTTRKFQDAQWEEIGTVKAKSKKEAIKLVYDAAWGRENDARITQDYQTLQHVNLHSSFKAEIDK